MELTEADYRQIEDCLPKHRGSLTYDNPHVLNAILYMVENGCKWRRLPKEFGNWHTIYYRMRRWAASGVLERVFEALQRCQIVRIKLASASLDSTSVKVHPDGTGALKNGPQSIGRSRGGLNTNFAKRLKSLAGLSPFQFICSCFQKQPCRFTSNPLHLSAGLNI